MKLIIGQSDPGEGWIEIFVNNKLPHGKEYNHRGEVYRNDDLIKYLKNEIQLPRWQNESTISMTTNLPGMVTSK